MPCMSLKASVCEMCYSLQMRAQAWGLQLPDGHCIGQTGRAAACHSALTVLPGPPTPACQLCQALWA